MTIDNSIVSNNKASGHAATGGGIMNLGDLTIRNSTISGNQAAGQFGNYGGGIETLDGTLIIENSTISGNKAAASRLWQRGWDPQHRQGDHREQHHLGQQGRYQVCPRGWDRQRRTP